MWVEVPRWVFCVPSPENSRSNLKWTVGCGLCSSASARLKSQSQMGKSHAMGQIDIVKASIRETRYGFFLT